MSPKCKTLSNKSRKGSSALAVFATTLLFFFLTYTWVNVLAQNSWFDEEIPLEERIYPTEVVGSANGYHFKNLSWLKGTRIVLVDDYDDRNRLTEKETPDTPWWTWKTTISNRVRATNIFEYTVSTYDGEKIGLAINGTFYSLKKGALFLLSVEHDQSDSAVCVDIKQFPINFAPTQLLFRLMLK